jgi:ribosomal-protein-alanine N-acetyltransferase
MARIRVNPAEVALRPWTLGDAEPLVRLGDDRNIWRNLRDRFPRPFTVPAADLWLGEHIDDDDVINWSQRSFAIWWRDQLTGGVHLKRRENEHRICADLTFWVGRPFWGRGIATAAVRAGTAYAFDVLLGLERVQTFVFDWTAESSRVPEGPGYAEAARVLENAGYTFEGRLRHYALKDELYGDALLYARLRVGVPTCRSGSDIAHSVAAPEAAGSSRARGGRGSASPRSGMGRTAARTAGRRSK